MLLTKLTVMLPRGLQARNTTVFVYKARSFNSVVILMKNGEYSNGKNIMRVMDLNVKNEEEITLLVNGDDENTAFHTLKNFLINGKV